MFPTVRGKESAIGASFGPTLFSKNFQSPKGDYTGKSAIGESFSTGRSRNTAIGASFGPTLFSKNVQSPKGDYTGKSAIGESFSTGRSRNTAIGGSFGRRTLFPKNFQSPKKKKKKSYLHITTVRKLSSRPTFLSHRQDEVRVRPRPGFFFFFFFDRAIFTRKTCTGVSSTLCENFGPIRPRVVAQSRKDCLPAPLFAIFRLFWPLSDEEKTFSPSSGNFRQRGTEISSISPDFPTRLVDPQKKEPIS